MQSPTYVSSISWREGRRVDTLVVHCSAYDYRPFFAEFIEKGLKLSEADVLAIPGGIQVLTAAHLLPKFRKVVVKMIRFLVEKHDLKKVVLIGHHDCGWYKDFRFGPIHIDLKDRQLYDLREVAAAVREELKIEVEVYYADLKDEKIVFAPVS